jgi:hypothetical protein
MSRIPSRMPESCLLATLLVCSCSARGGTTGESSSFASGGAFGTGTGGSLQAPTIDGAGAQGSMHPDETEQVSSFRAPVVTGRYLWTANPTSGRVALIDAQSLTTRIVAAGLFPTYLAALPTQPESPEALVLNTGSSDATLLSLEGDEIRTRRVPTHVGANRWAIEASGRFAAAWSAGEPTELDPTEGFQEVTLIELSSDGPETRRLTVGYRPSLLLFDDHQERLVVVAQRGVSLIDLETAADQWVELEDRPGRDVSITPDGRHALLSWADSPDVEVLPLDSPADRIVITLSGPVTDLDLATGGRAVAVVREQSLVATFLVNEVLSDATAVQTQTIASELIDSAELSDSGDRAVLYTNALDNQRVSIVELALGDDFLSYRTLDTQAPVQSVTIAPGGAHAVAVGRGMEGSSSGSFSILSLLEQRFPRVVGTTGSVRQVALSDRFAVVTAATEDGRSEVHLAVLSELASEAIRLASPPSAAGVVPDSDLGFVSQDHPAGRVTFLGFSGGRARTLTGFELSAEVVE